MLTTYLLGGSSVVLVLGLLVVALLVRRSRKSERSRALEQARARDYAGLALIRYIMLNRQCSEEVAYKRVAAFVKRHVPMDDYPSIERMMAQDRRRLIERAQRLLASDPDEIDKI